MPNNGFYYAFVDGGYRKIGLKELVSYKRNSGKKIWSARLGTGLFGFTSCESGNKGPKEFNEVLLSTGDEGLSKLVQLGFITCPACMPEKSSGFWEVIQNIVYLRYGLKTLEDYTNKEALPFDARRVEWEEVLPVTGKTPNRLYIPKDVSSDNLLRLKKRFERFGFSLPPVGYYNSAVPEKFTEYKVC